MELAEVRETKKFCTEERNIACRINRAKIKSLSRTDTQSLGSNQMLRSVGYHDDQNH